MKFKPPEFYNIEVLFKVIRKHDDALSRICHKAVRIMNLATMNSKSEIKGHKIARLSVSKSDWQIKKILRRLKLQPNNKRLKC